MQEYRLLFFLAISQVLQNLWQFEIWTWESRGKPKKINMEYLELYENIDYHGKSNAC